ncbi:MAG: hydroxyethylthiazole kinase [Acidilobaceae archaeon]|nr:hydroxyethylthiazole kinase [Acidilobaceae archaeon]
MNPAESLRLIRERRPLVHHIMNFVAMNDAANATLAIGASPIMAMAEEELEEVASAADAVYINIGTPTSFSLSSALKLARLAGSYGKPLLLDPVGVGASSFRRRIAIEVLSTGAVSVLKGNAGEMLALAGKGGLSRGVESSVEEAYEPLERLSKEYGVVAVSTGKTDYVAYGSRLAAVSGGSELFRLIAGSGCMLGSVMASFLAVQESFRAAAEASAAFKLAGELAELKAGRNPGSFRVELLNALHSLHRRDLSLLTERIRLLRP